MISWYFFYLSTIYSRQEHRLRCSKSYLLKPSLTFSTTCPILSRNLSSRFLPSTINCFIKSYALFSISRSLEFSAFSCSFSYITSMSFPSNLHYHRNRKPFHIPALQSPLFSPASLSSPLNPPEYYFEF